MVEHDELPLFAARLDQLIASVHPPGRGPYTNEEVADGVRQAGGPSRSVAYIQQLRTGRRDQPTFTLVVALARFFQVPVGYFAPGPGEDQPAEDMIAAANRGPQLQRLVQKLQQLDSNTLHVLDQLIDNLSRQRPGDSPAEPSR